LAAPNEIIRATLYQLAENPGDRATRRAMADQYEELGESNAGWFHRYLASLPLDSLTSVAGFTRCDSTLLEVSRYWLGLGAEQQQRIRNRVRQRFSHEPNVQVILVGALRRRALELQDHPGSPLLYWNTVVDRWTSVQPRNIALLNTVEVPRPAFASDAEEQVLRGQPFGQAATPHFVIDSEEG
jgi:hypothetical protein